MIKVLFVCLGNICRSPTADGVFRQMVASAGLKNHIFVDSCGTGDWHIGHPPDKRASAAAASRGYDLSSLRARQVSREDFNQFDHILAMDHANMADLQSMCPPDQREKLRLFLEFAPELEIVEVPDPYYGGDDGFNHVLNMVESASEGLLQHLKRSL